MRREVGALGSALLGLVLACSARQAPGTRTEAQVIAPAAPCEVESAVARVREEMNRGQLYRAWRRLEESPSCALDDVRVQHLKLELLWELRDLPALTELAGRLLAANPKNAAAREAQRRVTSYRAAARLGAAERAEYERLLESLAKANAEQDPKARELFERARGLGESGELLFEGGLLAQQAGRRAEARRLWDAATTLLEAEFGAAPEALEHQAKRRPTLWAGESHLWFGSLLYDFARRRFVAYVPRSPDPLAKRRDVFAAADDWVFFDGELWSVASGRRVGVIPAEAAVSAPSGEHLYVLSGPDVLRYSTHDGTLLEREGRLERSASSARAPASMLVTPSEAFLGVMALSKRVVFDLQRGRELLEVDAFDFVVLDGDWMARAESWGVEALHLPTKKKVGYRFRQPPFGGGVFEVSRNGRRFMILEPAAEETVIFEVPRVTDSTLAPLSRVDPAQATPLLFSPDGSRIAAECEGDGALETCFIDPLTGRRTGSVTLPGRAEHCRFGIRVYPRELCEPRLEEAATR
jgi:tetratricopeptide (TPR) repeat protein